MTIFQYLLKKGSQWNETDNEGRTPLHWAILSKQVAKLVLVHGEPCDYIPHIVLVHGEPCDYIPQYATKDSTTLDLAM